MLGSELTEASPPLGDNGRAELVLLLQQQGEREAGLIEQHRGQLEALRSQAAEAEAERQAAVAALQAERDARMEEVTAAAGREAGELRKALEAAAEREAAGAEALRAMLVEAPEGAAAEAGRVRDAVQEEMAVRLVVLEAEHDKKVQVRGGGIGGDGESRWRGGKRTYFDLIAGTGNDAPQP